MLLHMSPQSSRKWGPCLLITTVEAASYKAEYGPLRPPRPPQLDGSHLTDV